MAVEAARQGIIPLEKSMEAVMASTSLDSLPKQIELAEV